jgi:hypothetical protein
MTPSETPTMTPSETPTMTPTMSMTPTMTMTMTPTPTATLPPLDFTLTSSCVDNNPSDNPTISTSNYSGSSTGFYYFSGVRLLEQDAINNIFTGVQYSNAFPNSYGRVGGFIVGQTYWVAMQDTGIPSRIITKSVVMVSCT